MVVFKVGINSGYSCLIAKIQKVEIESHRKPIIPAESVTMSYTKIRLRKDRTCAQDRRDDKIFAELQLD